MNKPNSMELDDNEVQILRAALYVYRDRAEETPSPAHLPPSKLVELVDDLAARLKWFMEDETRYLQGRIGEGRDK